tara:strand:- start:330 stop:830 length:501 start_codon:yes stop_codon:yes gene_type:complete
MKNHITIKIILTFFISSLLFSCSKKNNNIDFDFTTLKKSKKDKVIDQENNNKINLENNIHIKDLVPLKDKQQVLSKVKFGKKDPFSKVEIKSNKLNSDFKLTGFLNTEIKKYVFVSYLDNEGTITEESIGGVNTNLLPNGAKVISIDPKNMKLIINFDNENFIFEM